MAGVASKIKSEFPNTKPAKRIKVSDDLIVNKRTVGTMCGAWRPEEEDGGFILVFKTREPCLSPDPEKESDRPENAADFWVASPSDIDDIQIETTDVVAISTEQHSQDYTTPLSPRLAEVQRQTPAVAAQWILEENILSSIVLDLSVV
ncbi:uncharacterized protein LOC113236873 isoform X2 [Hyposmocoma kahamanoa]|uniref:uncharacterized protein LOC113236873 isoform X2 n=1 Tax=Hyposmocoma kahamanoa TaxID=1477025 RepID=UPI000E6D88F5|nr:uncharacterized protein LOC113236873 isoform X2 [Hyposmocoma kahamanoa]